MPTTAQRTPPTHPARRPQPPLTKKTPLQTPEGGAGRKRPGDEPPQSPAIPPAETSTPRPKTATEG